MCAVNNAGMGTDYPDFFLGHPMEMQRNVLVVNTLGPLAVS
jgi:short-subunit dehydrogenase